MFKDFEDYEDFEDVTIESLAAQIAVTLMTSPIVRPIRRHMLLDWKELEMGQVYIMHSRRGEPRKVRILEIHIEGSERYPSPHFFYTRTDYECILPAMFADYCLLPYHKAGINGEDVWNETNWLEKIV